MLTVHCKESIVKEVWGGPGGQEDKKDQKMGPYHLKANLYGCTSSSRLCLLNLPYFSHTVLSAGDHVSNSYQTNHNSTCELDSSHRAFEIVCVIETDHRLNETVGVEASFFLGR